MNTAVKSQKYISSRKKMNKTAGQCNIHAAIHLQMINMGIVSIQVRNCQDFRIKKINLIYTFITVHVIAVSIEIC